MALSQENNVLWSDMSDLLTRLNQVRQKFGYSTIGSLTGGQGNQTKPTTLSELKDGLGALTTNTYVGNKADVSSIIIPNAGDLLKVEPFLSLSSKITDAYNTCAFDTSFFSSNNGFNSSFFSSNNGFRSSFFSSDNSFRSSFFSSDNSFRSSFFSSNNSFRSSFFSSNNSFRSNSSFNSNQNGFGFAFQSSVRSGDNSFSFSFRSSPSHSGFGSNRSYHSGFRGGFSGN